MIHVRIDTSLDQTPITIECSCGWRSDGHTNPRTASAMFAEHQDKARHEYFNTQNRLTTAQHGELP